MATRASSDLAESVDRPLVGPVLADRHSDNLSRAYLRTHFMNAVLTDPRVAELFDQWGKQTGLDDAADAVAHAADALANAAKASHWMAALELPDDEADRVSPFVEAFETAAEQFLLRLRSADRPPFRPTPAAFVRDTLRLRWSWLPSEVVDCFFRHVSTRAFGAQLVRSITVAYPSPLAPQLAWHVHFETNVGETVTEARARLLGTMAEAGRAWRDTLLAIEQAEQKTRGQRSSKDKSSLRHKAEWFYRAEVKQPADSISVLVREYARARQKTPVHELPRRLVQGGISNAKRLLGEGTDPLREQTPPRRRTRRKTAR